jgi:hypothetical protein
MLRPLKTLFLIALLTLASKGQLQQADSFDTLYSRGNNAMYVPKYDTIKQLKKANEKADTILNDLELIKEKLGIATMGQDSTYCKQKYK